MARILFKFLLLRNSVYIFMLRLQVALYQTISGQLSELLKQSSLLLLHEINFFLLMFPFV